MHCMIKCGMHLFQSNDVRPDGRDLGETRVTTVNVGRLSHTLETITIRFHSIKRGLYLSL